MPRPYDQEQEEQIVRSVWTCWVLRDSLLAAQVLRESFTAMWPLEDVEIDPRSHNYYGRDYDKS